MKEIIEIIKNKLEIEKESAKEYKGGMKEFLETLQDSDTFYNEASSLGAIDALEDILKKIEGLNDAKN